jgi:hypothetical protein
MANVDAELRKALEAYKSDAAKLLTKDWQVDSPAGQSMPTLGLQQYNLFPTALTLYPVLTPLRNILTRLQGRGRQSEFKAILRVGGGPAGDDLASVFGSEGNSGAKIDPTIEDIVAVYRSLKQAAAVSFEQQWEGQGYIDTKSAAAVNLLRQFMINEERAILFAGNSSSALTTQFAGGAAGVATSPTVTVAGSAGSIANNGSVSVAIVAVTGMGPSIVSAVVDTAGTDGGSGDAYTVSFPQTDRDTLGLPILYWEVYALQDAVDETPTAASALKFQGTSNGADFLIKSIANGALLGTTRNADASASRKAYNGLYTQLYGSAAGGNHGLGFAGAHIKHAMDVLSVTGSGDNSLESLEAQMWNEAFTDPRWALMNEAESRAVSRATLGQGTPYFINVPEDKLSAATAGFRVSRLTNVVTGSEIEVKVHPYFKQGSIILGSDVKPQWYVPETIPATIAIDAVQDYTEVDYPPKYATDGSGDNWTIQIMNLTTFKCFIPAIFGVLDSIVKA